MGADASAAIIYGFPFEGENFEFDDESYREDPEVWLAQFQGLPEPDGDCDTNEDAWRKYWDARSNLPITFECEGDMMSGYTNTYLCIRASRLDGSWDEGTEIPVDHVKPPPSEWNVLLKAFCEKAGVEFKQPRWYLIASYG